MSFYKMDGNSVVFNEDGEVIYFVPDNFFESQVAVIVGDSVELIGAFQYALFDKNGKMKHIKPFKCPTKISCKPSSITKEVKYKLVGTDYEDDYRLLHFKKGDPLIVSTKTPMVIENIEKFTNLLMRAKLPETIPYEELYSYIMKNAELNKFNYSGVSPQIIGVLVSELCRDAKDLSKPYRMSDMKGPYKAISILKVPKYTSAYTAITSENADEAIAAAMTIKSNIESPLEKIMMESANLDENIMFDHDSDSTPLAWQE